MPEQFSNETSTAFLSDEVLSELSTMLEGILNTFEARIKNIRVKYPQFNTETMELLLASLRSEKETLFQDPSPEKFIAFQTKAQKEILSAQIDAILGVFETQIKDIGSHHLKAKEKAQELLDTLKSDKAVAFLDPNPEKLKGFADKAQKDIKQAIPLLQKDLGWGDYLSNLAKEIVNAVTTFLGQVFSLGKSKHQGFFSIKESKAVEGVQEIARGIKNRIS